jgi:hypothetical protein
MEKTPNNPTIVTKLQPEQYADLLRIVPEEVFAEFNASLDKAKERLRANLHHAMCAAGPDILRDRDLLRRLLAQLRPILGAMRRG